MQAPVDPELITAGVYVVIVPLYFVLWRRHSRHCYAALAVAALILALCALLRSEAVRAWDLHPPDRQLAPMHDYMPDEQFSRFAARSIAPRSAVIGSERS